MKFSMFITENAMQVNLTPENDHERKFIKMLEGGADKNVTISTGISIQACQGGYIRNFGDHSESLAITIRERD